MLCHEGGFVFGKACPRLTVCTVSRACGPLLRKVICRKETIKKYFDISATFFGIATLGSEAQCSGGRSEISHHCSYFVNCFQQNLLMNRPPCCHPREREVILFHSSVPQQPQLDFTIRGPSLLGRFHDPFYKTRQAQLPKEAICGEVAEELLLPARH